MVMRTVVSLLLLGLSFSPQRAGAWEATDESSLGGVSRIMGVSDLPDGRIGLLYGDAYSVDPLGNPGGWQGTYLSIRELDGNWTTTQLPLKIDEGALTFDQAGVAHIAGRVGLYTLHYLTFTGGNWTTEIVGDFSSTTGAVSMTKIAVACGHVVITWLRRDGSGPSGRYSVFAADKRSQIWEISPLPAPTPNWMDIAHGMLIDLDGRVRILRSGEMGYYPSYHGVCLTTLDPDGEARVEFLETELCYSNSPNLGMDSKGTLHASYEATLGTPSSGCSGIATLRYRKQEENGSFSLTTVPGDSPEYTEHALKIEPDGTVHILERIITSVGTDCPGSLSEYRLLHLFLRPVSGGWQSETTPALITEPRIYCNPTRDHIVRAVLDRAGNLHGFVFFRPNPESLWNVARYSSGSAAYDRSEDLRDTDGDGIRDTWEESGIPLPDGTGNYFLSECNLCRKDLYVEVDAMEDMEPLPGVLESVVAAFGRAPVWNPDGSSGVDIHFLGSRSGSVCEPCVDDSRIQRTAWGFPGWAEFYSVKQDYFGTDEERSSVNRESRLGAKALVFRYGVFASSAVTGAQEYLGAANFDAGDGVNNGCNNFFVALGPLANVTAEDQAGSLMHEFGHTLGLYHGGDVEQSTKPNYFSVMNYLWIIPNKYRDLNRRDLELYRNSWELDYSRRALPPLETSGLDEGVGIQGYDYASKFVPVGFDNVDGCALIPPGKAQLVQMLGPVDWNANRILGEQGINVAANFIPGVSIFLSSPACDELTGFDDWGNIRYLPNNSPMWIPLNFNAPALNRWSGSSDSIELNEPTIAMIEQLAEMSFDCNGNDVPDHVEIADGSVHDGNANGIPDECEGLPPVAVEVVKLSGYFQGDGIVLQWSTPDQGKLIWFQVDRREAGEEWIRVTEGPISGGPAFEFTDSKVVLGHSYEYRLEASDRAGSIQHFGPIGVEAKGPARLFVTARQNPFRGVALLSLQVPRSGTVRLQVFDGAGRLVRDLGEEWFPSGERSVTWNGRDSLGRSAAAGLYLIRADMGVERAVLRIIRQP